MASEVNQRPQAAPALQEGAPNHASVTIGWHLSQVVACALLAIAASSAAVADSTDKQRRSAFEYHDGRAVETRPYRYPNLDIDPTDLTTEELKARISALEERIEKLERIVGSSEQARR